MREAGSVVKLSTEPDQANQPLPLDQAVTVEFTPKKSGEIRYACGMDHIAGVVFVP